MATTLDRFYDSLEVRDAEERDLAQLTALPGLVRHAVEQAPGLAADLAGVDPDSLTSFAALAAAAGPAQERPDRAPAGAARRSAG